MARTMKLSHSQLLEVLDFNADTGVFTWKVARSNRVKVGSRAGVLHQVSGGRYISINNEKVMAHRLAFFFANKRWPNTDVRPLDGNYDNCALSNLVEVSRVELAHKREKVATNTSGHAGVSRALRGRWQSKITWNYEQISLGGNFETAEEAGEIYDEAARRLKESSGPEDTKRIILEVRLLSRQRSAWKYLKRAHADHTWPSFETFCGEVTEVPKMKYAMVALDQTQPIGPGNFRWALPIDTEFNTVDMGRVGYRRALHKENRDHFRHKHLKKTYNIGMAEFVGMLNTQGGVCAICGKDELNKRGHELRALSVDHNHDTGALRGLLCGNCNEGLGYFFNDPRLLRSAAEYAEQYGDGRPVWTTPSLTEITQLPIGQKILMEAALNG